MTKTEAAAVRSGGREQQEEKFTPTTLESKALSMEATKAYPQDIDAKVLRKPKENHSMSRGREQQEEKFTLTTSRSNAISMEATREYRQDIDATAFREPIKNIAFQEGENNKKKSSR